ncbi:M23 family metallopeptidase [Microbacterium sp. gxy059]|uniref:M23 family metallopeptidase n=1 Tax=Microbacterium sp. gxy059 TaxID=2957199 RepID=UPI003D956431
MRRALAGAYRHRAAIYVVAVAAILVLVLAGLADLPDPVERVRWVLVLVALAGMALCGLLALAGSRLLPERSAVRVVSPVSGRWRGMNSPASKVPSHGVRMYGQAYAIDLVAEPDGPLRPAFGGEPFRDPAEYPAFGAPVRAMIDGVVVRVDDRQSDHRARSNTLGVVVMMAEGLVRELGGVRRILGNHVTIRGDDGAYALVAHLQCGSASVAVGDRVRAGQTIGRCGNTGNTSEPHVHAQIMDRENPVAAQGIPMSFAGLVLDGDEGPVDGLPRTDQVMVAPPAHDGEDGGS